MVLLITVPYLGFTSHFIKSDFFSEVKENFTTVLSNFEFESLSIENNNLVDQSAMLYEEYTKKGYQSRTEHLLELFDDTEIQYVINNMMYYNETGQIKTSINQIEKQFIGKVDKAKILAAIDNYDKFLDDTWIDVTYKETVPMKTGNNNYILHYEVHKEKPKLFTSPKTNIVDFTDHILIEQKYSAIGELTKYHLYEVKNNINNLKRHGKVPNIKMIFIVNTKYGNLVIDYLSVNSEVRITASDARDLYFALDIEKILNRVINNKSI